MKKPRPKQPHIIPKMSLKHFVDSSQKKHVWTYDVKQNKWWDSKPEETATQGNFYTIIDEEGNYHDDLERWLSDVESKATPVYKGLLKGNIPCGQERIDFATFLSSLYARSPVQLKIYGQLMGVSNHLALKAIASDPAKMKDILHEVERREFEDEEVQKVIEFIDKSDKYKILIDHQATLKALGLSDKLQEIFFDMSWSILASENQQFITSDNPVVKVSNHQTHHPVYGDRGFLNKTAYVTFPLSPNYCLHLSWQSKNDVSGVRKIDNNHAKLLNRQRAFFCDRFLFSSKKDYGVQKLGQKYKDFGINFKAGGLDFPKVSVVRDILKI